jgi:hypothetical protein
MDPQNKILDDYLEELSDDHKPLVKELRELIHNNLDVDEEFDGGNPVFTRRDDKLLFVEEKRDYVKLGFFDGRSLDDPYSLFEGTGRKIRYIKLRDLDDEAKRAIRYYLEQMVAGAGSRFF